MQDADESEAMPDWSVLQSEVDHGSGVYAFDRRRERRARVTGWAKVINRDPMRSFFGGAMELVDVSSMGVALLSDRPLSSGDEVEVRLAPFKVRGRVGRVVNCVPTASVPVLALCDLDSESGLKEDSVMKPRWRVAISYARNLAAA